ncbi:hypothetical protein V8C35DRAFT_286123 [Trichoderma chlorosporum]
MSSPLVTTASHCIHQDHQSLCTALLPEMDHTLINLFMACHIHLDIIKTLAEQHLYKLPLSTWRL